MISQCSDCGKRFTVTKVCPFLPSPTLSALTQASEIH